MIPKIPCARCGRPATRMIQDLLEGEPVKDKDGDLWITKKAISRFELCDEHYREPIIIRRDGTIS